MTTRKIALFLTLTLIVVISVSVLRAQTSQETNDQMTAQTEAQTESYNSPGRWRELQAQRLEGSWVHFPTPVLPPGTPPLPIRTTYITIGRGGTVIGSDRLAPFSNPLHGTWAHLGGNRFAWTVMVDNFDATGKFLGTLKARARITLISRDEFVGVSTTEFRDADGHLVMTRCATNRGERIKVEAPTDECRNITPPQ